MAPMGCGQRDCQVPGPHALPHTCVFLPKPMSLSSRPAAADLPMSCSALPACGSLTYGTTPVFPTHSPRHLSGWAPVACLGA